MQLRFASFAVANLREDFHLQDRAHAGRTTENAALSGVLYRCLVHRLSGFPVWVLTSHPEEVAFSIIALHVVSYTKLQFLFTPNPPQAQ
jgi:hypothetical protein